MSERLQPYLKNAHRIVIVNIEDIQFLYAYAFWRDKPIYAIANPDSLKSIGD